MSDKFFRSKFDWLLNNPLVDILFCQSLEQDTPSPPPGESLMITEILGYYMITETGDFMITET